MRREALRRSKPQREFNQKEKAGAHYGRRECKTILDSFFKVFYLKKIEICFGGSLGVLEMYSEKKRFLGKNFLRSHTHPVP